MADTLESLEIKVVHTASSAESEIQGLARAVEQLGSALRTAMPQMKDFASALDKVKSSTGKVKVNTGSGNAAPMSEWAKQQTAAVEGKDTTGLESVTSAVDPNVIRDISQIFGTLRVDIPILGKELLKIGKSAASGIGRVAVSIANIGKAAASAVSHVAKLGLSLGKIAMKVPKAAVSGIANSVSNLGNRIKKSIPYVENFVKSLKRIAFYRFLRTIIKEITTAFKEGLENAYLFSQGIAGEGHRFAEAMDSMSTAGLTMKNQLGSAFISLLTALAPIINAIIGLVTRLANALAQIFAAFTGSTYLKSADVPKKWAEAAGGAGKAAKEWKNQLLGFDEINRLEEPNDGGGGGGASALDPSQMFEDSPINEKIKKFVDDFKAAIQAGDWKGAGELLGNKINEIFPTADQWAMWGANLGYGINGAIQTLYYTIKTIDFYTIGQSLADFLSMAIEQINFQYLGGLLVLKITAALDFLLGFLGNLNWKLIGKSIFDFLMGALREANEWLESKDWEEIGNKIFQNFKDLISEIDFAALAEAFFTFLGLAFGAIIGILDGFFRETIEGIKEYFKEKFEEAGGNVVEGLLKGIMDAIAGIYNWCREHIVDPFVNSVKSLLGIHSPSTVFESIGSSIIDGLQNGVSGAFGGFMGTIESLFGNLISWCQSAHTWIQDVLDGISLIGNGGIGGFIGGLFGVEKRASGGFVDEGQLFVANEAGAEMVGAIGSRTAVANNDQIVEGIRQGVFEAVMAAQSNGNNDVNVKVYLDSREIKSGQNRLSRAMGVG